MKTTFKRLIVSFFILITLPGVSMAAQVFATDVVVQGSECIGGDCPTAPSFGFDTLRFVENNLRIHFDDSSDTASFPGNDWRITINDKSNGGLNKFSIDDVTSGRTPFTIEAGALANSLYIETPHDNGARIGFGTNTPVTLLHALNGNTPTIRLEQDGRNGWAAYTWDIAANETNFFVRDVGNGKLPFRIRPGAIQNSICINSNSNIGLGLDNPSASLHIKRTVTASDNMLLIQNNSLNMLTLDGSGNLTAAGTISHGSSRIIKKEIENVDPDDILSRLLQLDIYTWQYNRDENITHLGPMAEDFGDIFGLGKDNKHIAPGDMGGIAFAAIQSLNEKVENRDQKINALEKENADLSDRLERLESLVESIMDKN